MEQSLITAIAKAKECEFPPKMCEAHSMVTKVCGPPPKDLTNEEMAAISAEEFEERQARRYQRAAFWETAPRELKYVETRVLYNVAPELTGDLSGIWGDAAGLKGCVNPGTTGNVTGLSGSLESLWGDVSNIFGSIHTHLYGTVSNLMGDITGKWGYCSMVRGDVSRFSKDLTYLEGDLTGLIGDRYDIEKYPALLAYNGVRIIPSKEREIKNHPRSNNIVGSWMRNWGDGSKASGVNTGVVGDVSNIDYDITGKRFDTAFVPPAPPDVPVNQVILPR